MKLAGQLNTLGFKCEVNQGRDVAVHISPFCVFLGLKKKQKTPSRHVFVMGYLLFKPPPSISKTFLMMVTLKRTK